MHAEEDWPFGMSVKVAWSDLKRKMVNTAKDSNSNTRYAVQLEMYIQSSCRFPLPFSPYRSECLLARREVVRLLAPHQEYSASSYQLEER